MKKIQLLGCASVLLCLFASSAFTARYDVTIVAKEDVPFKAREEVHIKEDVPGKEGVPLAAHEGGTRQDCNDCANMNGKTEDCCKKPVRRNGSTDDCYCFTCETGTNKEHLVCTRNETIKSKLFSLVTEAVSDNLANR